ncbi:hypothetical protein INT43_001253 [Umbelopsis isabellina]|uniref:Uncharacterized protein n=1 Tax=Mortierella isabellina TaxID=91625 RepID=A0A8H7PLV8_MORIS|nr:hypothetical protein INT43_001253 [Umbelopsis isabellina]
MLFSNMSNRSNKVQTATKTTSDPSVSKLATSKYNNDPVRTTNTPDTPKDFVNPMGGQAFLQSKARDITHTGA